MPRPWTLEEETALLATPATREAEEELARRLLRTPTALWIRRHRILPKGRAHTRWTADQDRIIRRFMAMVREFEEELGLPHNAIRRRANQLAEIDGREA